MSAQTFTTKGLVAILLGALVLTACAIPVKNTDNQPTSSPLIARDLVGVLVQLDPLAVETTVLKLSAQAFVEDDFAVALRRSLEDAGYAIRISGSTSDEKIVSFSVIQKSDPVAGPVSTYTVNAGDVSVRRSYALSADGLARPIGAMQVRGADARAVQHNNALFEQSDSVVVGELAVQGESLEPLVIPAAPPVVTTTPSVAPPAAPEPELPALASASSDTPRMPVAPAPAQVSPSVRSAAIQSQPLLDIAAPSMAKSTTPVQEFGRIGRLADLPTQNVRDLGESNFAGIFDEFGIVDEAILRFGNDSIRLGQGNKSRVRRFVEQFDADSDVLSVIGCSNGPTSLAMGQEGLALGRAKRVKEELLYAGVPEANILDEGCWAEESFDYRMPRRGVVLTLKRRAS